jgi:hypothetical protein
MPTTAAGTAPTSAGLSIWAPSPSAALSAWAVVTSSGPAILVHTARAVAISGGAAAPVTAAVPISSAVEWGVAQTRISSVAAAA